MGQQFHFGEFTLDQTSYRLQRGDRALRLERLPMELLILLVQRRGELVSRDEIAERLWGKGVFLDVDHGINTAVRKIRSTLRDDPEKPRYLETVVGKGYRFAAPVTLNGDPVEERGAIAPPPTVGALPPVAPRANARRMWIPAGVAVAAVLLATGLLFVHRPRPTTTAPKIQSLVVLPLRNLSGDPNQEYFADGMTEAVIGRLSMIPGLRVISRTSAMRFKTSAASVPEIARMLRVDAVVEGSVLRENDRVRVTVQLIRGATDEHIWAQSYDREYQSILALQDDVARTIAGQVRRTVAIPLLAASVSARKVDPEAHEAYLKGRYYLNQRTEAALLKSIEYFQQAIAKDPTDAGSYCGMADAYALLGFRGRVPAKDSLSRAKSAALKAIDLDDSLGDAHASLAFIAETHEWDWATAEREYKRALELNPGDARTHNWYAGYLTYTGRFEEGVVEAKRARELDPLSLPINNALAGRLLVAGRSEEALNQVHETLQLDAHFAPAHQTLGWIYLNRAKSAQAIEEFQQALLSETDDTDLSVDLGYAYAVANKPQEARRILARLEALHARGLVQSGALGILYGALGETDKAFAWLDKAYEERDPELTYLKVPGRRFAPLQKDPRYRQLVRRMGLPD